MGKYFLNKIQRGNPYTHKIDKFDCTISYNFLQKDTLNKKTNPKLLENSCNILINKELLSNFHNSPVN